MNDTFTVGVYENLYLATDEKKRIQNSVEKKREKSIYKVPLSQYFLACLRKKMSFLTKNWRWVGKSAAIA